MIERIDKVLTLSFALIWGILIFSDYWYYHPEYGDAVKYFQYIDLVMVLALLGGGIGYGLYKSRSYEKILLAVNGLGILALFLIISGIIIVIHFPKVGGNLSLSFLEVLTYLGKMLFVVFASYVVFMVCYVIGDFLFNKVFSFSFGKKEGVLLRITTGLTILSMLLVLLGTMSLLEFKFLLPLLVLIMGLGWASSWRFLQTTLLSPIKGVQQLNWLGMLSFYLLLIFVSLNFLQNIRPFPFGFDALAIYLNLPKLIGETHALIEGYSPYYWSIFVSLGFSVFDQIEVTIALSIFGGILSLFAIYEIARKWLDPNRSLLTVLLFYSLPLINYQSYRDVKTDLGLLFILLSIVLVLIKWLSLEDEPSFKYKMNAISNSKKKKNTNKNKVEKKEVEKIVSKPGFLAKYLREENQLIILLGILSGMAIGIKLTGLIVIFGVLGAFSYLKGGKVGFITSVVLMFFVLLVGGLDVASGLRAYHFGVDTLKKVLPILGLVGIVGMFIKKRNGLLNLIKISFIYALFTGLVYLPWPIKNYNETKVLSIDTFIQGKELGAPSNVDIIRNAKD